MPNYSYKSIDIEGEVESGFIIADSLDEAKLELKNRKLIPLKIKESKNIFRINFFSNIGSSKLSLISRQLSALVNSGVPIDQALDSVAQQIDPHTSNVLKQVSLRVKSGFKLSESLEEYPQSFDKLFCTLIKAGESSGELGKILEKTADFLEKKAKMSQEIIGALVYPIILFTVAIGIISLLLTYVVPSVVSQFSTLDQGLPFLTQALLFISNLLSNPFLYIGFIILFFITYLSLRFYGFKKAKLRFHKSLLSIPILKNFLLDADLSRFASSLSILRTGNVSILEALSISSETISNHYLRDSIFKASRKVGEGESISKSLNTIQEIPGIFIQMISSGEKTGNLEPMLEKLSNYLDSRFQNSTKIAMNLLEPLVIIILGLFVSLIVLAILLPLIQLNTLSTTL